MNIFQNLVNLFYPKLCLSCKNPLLENENLLCHHCLSDLSFTLIPFNNTNPVFEKLISIVKIEYATSVLFYNKKGGVVSEIIHQLKYNNHPELGALIADFMQVHPDLYKNLKEIDFIIPVPLHPKKFRKRGYNQLTAFGKKLENHYQIPYDENILLRKINTESQTKKDKEARRQNVSGAFVVKNPETHYGKHFLIVDDVMTTGATLESCAETILNKIENAKVSVLTMSVVL